SCPSHVLDKDSKKLDALTKYMFVGYLKGTNGGLFYNPKDNTIKFSTQCTFL
ncbi:hypothetical protein J1N35_024906, partial [Gossypium stocksii]